jgi:hypothetical protein
MVVVVVVVVVVRIVTRLDSRQEIFFFLQNIQASSRAYPASYSKGNGVSFPGSKGPGLQADQSTFI